MDGEGRIVSGTTTELPSDGDAQAADSINNNLVERTFWDMVSTRVISPILDVAILSYGL